MSVRVAAVRRRGDRERVTTALTNTLAQSYDVDLSDGSGFSVVVSFDNIGGQPSKIGVTDGSDHRWHVSVAGDETPTWEQFVAIVHRVRPGVAFCVPLPTPDKWVNVHEHCLHAWQIDDDALEQQWAAEGRMARTPPT